MITNTSHVPRNSEKGTNVNASESIQRMIVLLPICYAAFTDARTNLSQVMPIFLKWHQENNKNRLLCTCRWSGDIFTLYLRGVPEDVELGEALRENCNLFPDTWHWTFCKRNHKHWTLVLHFKTLLNSHDWSKNKYFWINKKKLSNSLLFHKCI